MYLPTSISFRRCVSSKRWGWDLNLGLVPQTSALPVALCSIFSLPECIQPPCMCVSCEGRNWSLNENVSPRVAWAVLCLWDRSGECSSLVFFGLCSNDVFLLLVLLFLLLLLNPNTIFFENQVIQVTFQIFPPHSHFAHQTTTNFGWLSFRFLWGHSWRLCHTLFLTQLSPTSFSLRR